MLTEEATLSNIFVLYFKDLCDELIKYMINITNNPGIFSPKTIINCISNLLKEYRSVGNVIFLRPK